MEILSYSVKKDKIQNGRKRRSMRPFTSKKWTRIYKKWKYGQKIFLQIWWKSRSKYRELMFFSELEKMEVKTLGDLNDHEWVLDGFEGKEDGFKWFSITYKLFDQELLDFKVYIVQFEPYLLHVWSRELEDEIVRECKKNGRFYENVKTFLKIDVLSNTSKIDRGCDMQYVY